ncbi:Fe-S oxidoreductase [Paenibacillus popilliae ATCC 14706]|jgi:hypothetical protein|uniref:Fe-S oxidoreductase n=1 Tax=Paenibacillus popilliae ATCC 14706 TaxID=1212764 RepID=M9LKY5_PAEPP|nr:hypothetical protein [Paenibacillus popilliae ATCC 14706]GAC40761.1 Fe-S oxidoreductase [Paenibacillus popilliae ATCC 14706]
MVIYSVTECTDIEYIDEGMNKIMKFKKMFILATVVASMMLMSQSAFADPSSNKERSSNKGRVIILNCWGCRM